MPTPISNLAPQGQNPLQRTAPISFFQNTNNAGKISIPNSSGGLVTRGQNNQGNPFSSGILQPNFNNAATTSGGAGIVRVAPTEWYGDATTMNLNPGTSTLPELVKTYSSPQKQGGGGSWGDGDGNSAMNVGVGSGNSANLGTGVGNGQNKFFQGTGQGNGQGGANTTFPGLIRTLGTTAGTSTPEYRAAQEQYLKANQALADLRAQEAIQNANIMGSRTNLAEAGGEQGLLQNLAAGKEAALTGEMNAATGAMGAATTQQQTQQSGLAAAGGLVQPQQAGPTNVPFNPATGEYGTPAAGAYGGGNGLQAVGNIQGQIGIGQNVAQLNSYLGGAQVVGKNLQNLITSANINPIGLTYANGLLQFGAKAMSDPNYQKFAGQINDFVASLAPILGVGGNITDMKTQMSSAIVNALQSGSTINDVISYFLDQAQQKVQGLAKGGGVGVGGEINSNGTTNANQFSW